MTLQILTPNGFKPFTGVRRSFHQSGLKFTFNDGSTLKTAHEHIFIVDGKEIFSKDLSVGQDIGKIIANIEICEGQYFYDPLNVSDGAIFSHDEVFVSHNSFHGTGNTLISADKLLGLTSWNPEFVSQGVNVYENPQADKNYIMTVDVAEGRGIDFSTFNIIDISSKPFRVVATFRDNLISPLLLPTIVERWAKQYNNAFVVVENNNQGSVVCNILYYDLEYENMFLSSTVSSSGIGVRMDKKIKHIGCSNLKDLIEQGQLETHDKQTIVELTTFVAKGKSFEAEQGCHDDLVMNLVLFAWFTNTPQFQESFDEELKMMLFKEKMQAIEEEVMPFGHYYNAAEDLESTQSVDIGDSLNFGLEMDSWRN